MLEAILAVGCGTPKRQEPAPVRPVELLVATESNTLDPRYATRALDVRLTRLVHAGLVALDPQTLEPKPDLAERLEREGERTIVITLRPEQRFHSGAPLRPEDVCATLSAMSDPAVQSPHRSIVESFNHCRVRGPLTLSVELKQPRATWMTDLELPILRAEEARAARRPKGNLDGLGPFRFSKVEDSAILLSPVDAPGRKAPRFPVVVRTVADENVRAMRILTHNAELAVNVFSPSLLSGFVAQGATVRSRPGANVTYLLINNDRSPFDKSNVRRALSSAIDRRSVTSHLLSGYARPARWLVPDGHWAAPEHLRELPFDQKAASTVLSGLAATTLLTSTDRTRVLQARAVGQMLSDAGMPTTIVPLELGILLSRLDAGQYTLAILQIPELTEPNLLRWFFHPRAIDNALEGRNRARYRNREAARLMDLAAMEYGIDRRRELYVQLASIMLDDMPVVPLWHEDHVVVSTNRGRNFLPSAEGRWAALCAL